MICVCLWYELCACGVFICGVSVCELRCVCACRVSCDGASVSAHTVVYPGVLYVCDTEE